MGARAPSVPLERTEFVRADQTYSILSRIVKATQVDTIVHTFLITNSTTVPSRALHEINVIGTMNLLAAAGAAGIVGPPGRGQVVDPRLRLGCERPDVVPRGHAAHRAAANTASSASLIEVEALVRRLRGGQPASRVTVLRFANVLGHRHRHADQPQPVARRCARPSSASTRCSSSWRRTTSSARSLTSPGAASPASSTWPATGSLPWSEVATICGTRLVPLSPYSPLAAPALWRRLFDLPPELEDLLRYGRGVDTTPVRRDGLHLQRHQRRRGAHVHPGAAAAPAIGTHTQSYTLRARRRAVLPPFAVGDDANGRLRRSVRATPPARFGSRAAHSSAVIA